MWIFILMVLWAIGSSYFLFFHKKTPTKTLVIEQTKSNKDFEKSETKNNIFNPVNITLVNDGSIIEGENYDDLMCDLVIRMDDLMKGTYTIPDHLIKKEKPILQQQEAEPPYIPDYDQQDPPPNSELDSNRENITINNNLF